ncbi:GDSL-type esterase/lipase family protein [Maribellus sediminis]|uniref:GDSL-type esterase/lipase family protein n=1 Tax=Maribellus sediminis TaxID=2696285 RepID=UPI00142F8267|nr:GDSL-type esterase/lipase family protein [Maribellus sediminis]
MKKIILNLVLLFSLFIVSAQENEFGTYYNQRLSLFISLPDEPNEIIMLGNSITDGGEWSELLPGYNVKNRGISGDVTAGVLYRLNEVTSAKPAKVFLLIGINDLARGIPADTVFKNICLIAEKIRATTPETEVYIQSILPVNPSFKKFAGHVDKTNAVKQINQKLNDWCSENDVEFVNLFDAFIESDSDYLDPEFTNDGLHLTAKGYLTWIKIIYPFIKS